MLIGVPKEIKTREYRVAMTPAGVRQLVSHGHHVLVQHTAGEGSGISDDQYVAAGATIVPGPADMTPPHLLGRDFTYLSALGVWKLHAWIFRPNPAGMFADYNPSVRQCP